MTETESKPERMVSRRRYLKYVGGAVVVAAVGVAAYGVYEVTKPRPITLRVLGPPWLAPTTPEETAKVVAGLVKEFEDENNVRIEFTLLTWEDLEKKTTTILSVGSSEYDVMEFDSTWTAKFGEPGWVVDLSEYVTEDMKTEYPIWRMFTYKDVILGWPYIFDIRIISYNEALLEKAGFSKPPATWDELADICVTMKEKGVCEYPWAQYLDPTEATVSILQLMIYSYGGKLLDENYNPVFNGSEGVQALEFLSKAYKDLKIIDPGAPTTSREDFTRIFLGGGAAFLIYSPDIPFHPAIAEEYKGRIRLCLIPSGAPDKLKSATVSLPEALGIPKFSKNKDLAWKFIKHWTSPSVQQKLGEAGYAIPTSVTALRKVEKIVDPEVIIEQAKYVVPLPLPAWYTGFSDALRVAISEAVTGVKTPKEALDAAAAKVAELKEMG